MQTRSKSARVLSLLCAALLITVAIPSAHAQETSYTASFTHNSEAIPVNVLVGQSRVINFDRPIGRFSVSNPEIAEAVLVAPDQVLVNGKAFGQVNFIAWEKGGSKFLVFDVFVRANLSLIDSQMRVLFPNDDIRLNQANGSVVISGSVRDPRTVKQVQDVIEAAGFKTVNMLQSPVRNIAQVQLQVRFAEVNRSRMREFGATYTSVGGGTTAYANNGGGPATASSITNGAIESVFSSAMNLFVFNNAIHTAAALQALRQQGAFRELAEPNLVAMDGQQASFLAGGEFPVPVVQNSGNQMAITVVFKEYGIRLNFKPTIIDEDHIRLELEPEVSTIDFATGVKFNGFLIPALRTRRAHTAVELRDGQAFALAGLLDNNETQSLAKIPVIGDIPILGNLFKSKSFQHNDTELIFFCTVNLVKPVSPDDLPRTRGTDGLRTGSPLGVEPRGEGIQGESGHSISTSTPAPTHTAPAATPAAQPKPSQRPAQQQTRPTTLPAAGDGTISLLPPSEVNRAWPHAAIIQTQAIVDMPPAP
ncbi:MAG: hypothetical protein AUG51_14605 [Acidobacteria bacterium 13_1_20CM_3_53_8]|nr:MAG: hypothetical protein AUG51_14605 [Acidobacteria bacterium 13_1_20CM_3_53_8]